MRAPFMIGTVLFVALFGLSSVQLSAGHFFRKKCGRQDVVKLPGREIVIEASRPNVVVNERSSVRGRTYGAPIVATIYTPGLLALPGTGIADDVRPVDNVRDLLQSGVEMQYHSLRLQELQAAQAAKMKATQQFLQGVRSSLKAQMQQYGEDDVKPAAKDKTGSASLQAGLDELTKKVDELGRRLDSIERLVIIHDNFVKKQMGVKP